MFLLDTNVISAARKFDRSVSGWIGNQGRYDLWLSVITLGEIARGVVKKERKDPTSARHLALWYQQLRLRYADRILDIDDQVVEEWGRIDAIRTRSTTDGLIAATAIVHNMTVVTRNVADFADTGVAVLNPWEL